MSPPVIDVDEAAFATEVVERSHQVPVVVDFWAAWCGPCRVLGPTLEKLAGEAAGAWVLAKVDVDRNPSLASAAGVQGIPAVRAFKGGRQVAEFVGALPEAQVRSWLAQLGPSSGEVLVAEARAAEVAGRTDEAEAAYKAALATEPGNPEARRGLARLELARRVAQPAPAEESDPIVAIERAADLDIIEGRIEQGLARLLEVVRTRSGDERERARVRLLALMDALDPDDPRVGAARRALSHALF